MTPKEFLSQAWYIDKRIERKIEERERLWTKLAAGRGTNLSGMPRGGHYDWTDSVVAMTALTESINKEIMELCRVKRQVNEAIEAVEEIRYRQVLELRYRHYMGWDAIAEEMGFAVRHIHRLHGKALQMVKVPDKS